MRIILLIFFMFSIYDSFSQIRQNDATLEETIEFIENNIRAFRGTLGESNHSGFYSKLETIEANLSYDKNILTVKNKRTYGFTNEHKIYFDIRKVRLNEVTSVEVHESENMSYFLIWASGLVECLDGNESSRCNFIEVGIDNYDMKQRLVKAFKHLGYLNFVRKKEASKNSKF
jgi:hypothetical protein